MKKTYFLIVFVLFLQQAKAENIIVDSTTTTSQDSVTTTALSDSVNIRSLLDTEIAAIKAKQAEEDRKNQTYVVSSTQVTTESEPNLIAYAFWSVELLLIVVILTVWYKKVQYRKKYAVKTLKINISKLREEKIIYKANTELSMVRKSLVSLPIRYDDNGRDIVRKAKEYSISKGEVYLAAKLKILAGEAK